MLILTHDDLIGLLPPVRIIAAVEAGLRAQAAGQVIMPDRQHIDWDGNTLLTMPSVGADAVGVKLVSVVPENAARGLPVTGGVMILHDRQTGLPVALMNAAALTAQRTGAVGALGVKYQTPAAASSIGIVGCGVQGAWQAICACAVRPIRSVRCFSRSPKGLERFIATVHRHAPQVEIAVCKDVRELIASTDIVIAATTSSTPVLPDDPALLTGKHFISVGSFKPAMQELPGSVYRLAGTLAVDSPHASHEVGDVINSLQQGLLQPEDVFSIAELVMQRRTANINGTTAYKCVGAAVYDLYVANELFRAAVERRIGQSVHV